jgi:hypothetical protein
MFRRFIGAVLLSGALYVAWARVPAGYPLVLKTTGVAVIRRPDMDKIAGIYLLTGAVGGLGLALIVWPHRKGRKS